MFPPPLQREFDIFYIHLMFTKYQQFLVNKLLCRFVGVGHHLKNVQVTIYINYVNKEIFSFKQWMQMMIKLQEHKK